MARKTRTHLVPVTAGQTSLMARLDRSDRYLPDLYHHMLTCSWPVLLLQIAAVFFLANALFALAYLIDGGIENARPGSFSDVYFFSVETMATIGYGKMSPVTFLSHIVMSLEALTGLMAVALVTGLVFAKFSRPTARIRFSHVAVVSLRDGVSSLMFRLANVRANQIVEAQIHVVFSRMETTAEGDQMRRFSDLALTRDRNAIFAYSWTVTHPIVPGSPLYGATAESLRTSRAWIVASVTGLDDVFSQTVYARMYYGNDQIMWGARLSDIMVTTPDGGFALDFDKFDDFEPAPLPLRELQAVPALGEPE